MGGGQWLEVPAGGFGCGARVCGVCLWGGEEGGDGWGEGQCLQPCKSTEQCADC
jgi:hypothetical protein